MKLIYPLFVLILACAACAGDNPEGTGGSNSTAAAQQDTLRSTPGTFYKRFSGTVGDQRITFNLEQYAVQYAAAYYKLSDSRPVKLIPVRDEQQPGTYNFSEMAGTTEVAKWELRLEGNTLNGKRTVTAGNATTAISLQEAYPEGSYALLSYYRQDTGRVFKNYEIPKATAEYGMLWPTGKWSAEQSAFVRSRITANMSFEGASGVAEGLRIRAYRYFAGYRNELRPIVDSTWPEAKRADMAYHYSTTFYHHILYNDQQWLVLENMTSNYTGGAHGTYSSGFQSLDMKENREWAITDVISDTAALKPYIELAIRDYFSIPATEELTSRLLMTEVPAPANFYISPSGLTFVYNPYELASYSDGEVHLFLPYEKLKPLLSPDFTRRMSLASSSGVALNAAPGRRITVVSNKAL